jgi:dinuclear metal center YbgI/SA1388 family protein
MLIADVLQIINRLAPERLAAHWDNSGVQIVGEAREISRLAVCLDPLPQTLAECLEWGAQFVLTHHPLYLKPQAPNRESPYLQILRLMLPAKAWLYAAHTTLDQAPDGPACWLGRELNLQAVRPLEPAQDPDLAEQGAGFGQVGELPVPLAWGDFADALARLVDRQVWTVVGDIPDKLSRIAYCPGSGGSLIPEADKAEADVFITGDIKYHQALEAPLAVVDVGHFCLEEEMTRRFADQVSGILGPHGVEVRFFRGSDPFRFRLPCA